MTVDSCTVDVDPGIELGELLHSGQLIRKRIVTHVAVIRLVEFFGARRVSHAIDLDHDETQFGECLRVATSSRETPAAHASRLRARIDMVDDWILPRPRHSCPPAPLTPH